MELLGMKKLVAFAMIALLVPAAATVALAKNPCKEDIAKFCKDAKAEGKGKLAACLRKNTEQLSAECKDRLDKRKAERDKKEGRDDQKDEGEPAAADKPAETAPSGTAPAEPATPAEGEPKQ
jgi:hypothetical protein